MATYYTFTKSQYDDLASPTRSYLKLKKVGSGSSAIYYTTNSKAKTSWGAKSTSSKPTASSSSGGSSSGGSSTPTYTVNGVRVSQSEYNKIQSDVANARAQGASLGWNAQQIQWAVNSVYASNGVGSAPDPADNPNNQRDDTSGGSSSSSGGRSSSDPDKYKYEYGGRSYEDKADATAASRADGGASSSRENHVEKQGGSDTTTTTTTSEETTDTSSGGDVDFSGLEGSDAFKKLSKDDQEAVRAVFSAIANNDQVQATRLTEAFKASSKINDPYFEQKMRLAVDAIERGYVAIDDQAEYQEQQIVNRRNDLRQDMDSRRDYLTLEQQTKMREIDRNYGVQLETLQNNMAATGFSSSSRRVKQRGLLDEATGDMRESSNRQFAYQAQQDSRQLARGERDSAAEIARLKELTDKGKLDFLRQAEEKVGTGNLPSLRGAPNALGDIYGNIPEEKLKNTISAATSFVF